jgi:predicted nucleic acid binding AN1-type Zn finger protein
MDHDIDPSLVSHILSQLLSDIQKKDAEVAPAPTPAPKDEDPKPTEAVKEKKKRCGCCNKKLGLITFPCKCGGDFCPLHRLSSDHNCSFDYREDSKKYLSSNLVKVTAKKVEVL